MKTALLAVLVALSILAPVHRPHLLCRGFSPHRPALICPGWQRVRY